LVYSGTKLLTDKIKIEDDLIINVGKLILSPTRTYAPVVKTLLDKLKGKVNGMVHCSGGAQTKVLHFVQDAHIIKDNLFPIPALFRLIQEQSGTSWAEMYKVFNMGHRLEIYLEPQYAQEVIEISQSFGIPAQIVGRVEPNKGKKLTIKSEFGIFEY
jgi:phosphoribosylformylglycinamidine cyclo-ligase